MHDTSLELIGAKVDEKPCRLMRDGQIVQQLRNMLTCKRLHGLQFDKQDSVDHKVSKIVPQHNAVIVVNRQWLLRLDPETGPFQPMAKAVLVDLLEQAVAKVDMQLVSRLPNFLNQILNFVIHFSAFSRSPSQNHFHSF